MGYCEQFNPPDLPPAAGSLQRQLGVGLLFHARQMPQAGTGRLLTLYMMTADKSAREYNAACRRIRDHMVSDAGIQAFAEGVGHFETCVNSIKRALRALERLGAKQDGPVIDRALRKLAQSQTKTMTTIRDAIEHIDGDIVSDPGIAEGDPHLLCMSKSGTHLEIGSQQLSLVSLHGVVKSLSDVGTALIQALHTPAAN